MSKLKGAAVVLLFIAAVLVATPGLLLAAPLIWGAVRLIDQLEL
jgi:hypothetical protein